MTIDDFCERVGISRVRYYALLKQGNPRGFPLAPLTQDSVDEWFSENPASEYKLRRVYRSLDLLQRHWECRA